MTKQRTTRLLVVVYVSLTLSCATPPRDDEGRRGDDGYGDHWVHDTQLRALMNDLDRQVAVSWPQEIEEEYIATTSASVARQLEEACWLADALAKAADKIPAVLDRAALNSAGRQLFIDYVTALRTKAERLEQAAAQADVLSMRRVLHSIDRTCNDCHNRFRAVAGPIS